MTCAASTGSWRCASWDCRSARSRSLSTVTEMTGDDRGVLSALYAKIDRQGAEAATKGTLATSAWESA